MRTRAPTIAAMVALLASFCDGGVARAAPRPMTLRLVFMSDGDRDRAALDAFADCLVAHSNLAAFFEGEVALSYGGSRVAPPPTAAIDEHSAAAWLDGVGLPADDGTTVHIVLAPAAHLRSSACGANTVGLVGGRTAGVAFVRIDPPCWPGTVPLRSETQIVVHELAEVIDQLLGHAGTNGDGACQGDHACADPCANFTGLACPGAPLSTLTGCDTHPVAGWVVQTLSHEGRDGASLVRCVRCDFRLRYCPGGASDPECAPQPVPTASGCAVNRRTTDGRGLFVGLLIVALFLLAFAWRKRRA